jgi:uncharacterized membrane protein
VYQVPAQQPPQQPPPPPPQQAAPAPAKESKDRGDRGRRTGGIILIVLGVLFLLNQFIDWGLLWPVVLIGLGLLIWFRR